MKKLFLILIICLPAVVYSTPAPPAGGGAPGCWPPPCTVPIDGGITFLIAAGAALGAKKLMSNKSRNAE